MTESSNFINLEQKKNRSKFHKNTYIKVPIKQIHPTKFADPRNEDDETTSDPNLKTTSLNKHYKEGKQNPKTRSIIDPKRNKKKTNFITSDILSLVERELIEESIE